VNAAGRALDAAVRSEQLRTVQRMAVARLVVGVLAVGVVSFVPMAQNLLDNRPTTLGAWFYFAVALLNFAVVVWRGRPGLWSAYAVPFLDVPLIACVQWLQVNSLKDPSLIVPVNVALMAGFTGLSAFSMSNAVIACTAFTASASIMVVARAAHVELMPMSLVLVATLGLAAVAAAMVGRVRRLVVDSRRRDLLGKYVLGERIGAGGMAEVFRATYSPEGGFERQVAIKRILPSYAEDPEWVALFRREAQLGASLAHPNIVQVLDFGADGPTYFLAMEYVDGVSLSRLLKTLRARREPLSVASCLTVALAVLEALDCIHSRVGPVGQPMALVHRDVNPPNILLSRIGEVKLADFGVAKSLVDPTRTLSGIVRGKLGYVAPEQLLSQQVDARADLFALGVTLHEMLTGQRLFQGPSDVDVLRATLEGPLPPPSALRPGCTTRVDALVMGLCERDPQTRTQTAAVAREQLLALTNDDGLNLVAGRAELVARVTGLLGESAVVAPERTLELQGPPSAPPAERRFAHAPGSSRVGAPGP
jgi:hypothetical protein